MKSPKRFGALIIPLSFIIALMLAALPLPDWALPWRPAWVAMVLAYWCLAVPDRVGVVTGWLVGLFLDVQSGALLGQYALGLACVAYVFGSYHQRVRNFPVAQQAVFVGLVTLLYLALMLAVDALAGIVVLPANLFAAVSTALLWPWIFIILRDARRKVRLS